MVIFHSYVSLPEGVYIYIYLEVKQFASLGRCSRETDGHFFCRREIRKLNIMGKKLKNK